VLRAAIFAATIVAAGCPSTRLPDSPSVADDRALRVRIAHAEARRARGVAELVELATGRDDHARELALRALGRTGGTQAIATLEAAATDAQPGVVVAALSAIGVLAALDDSITLKDDLLVAALARRDFMCATDRPCGRDIELAALEALGRAGSVAVQGVLAERLADPALAAQAALALGRHGRRKLALSAEARASLIRVLGSRDPDVRYTATYALAREHQPPADAAAIAALAERTSDEQAEVRATAIAGLARRNALANGGAARSSVERALADRDWRVAVEAVRALAAADDAGGALVLASLAQAEPRVVIEGLRALLGKGLAVSSESIARTVAAATAHPAASSPIARGWIECLAPLVASPPPATLVDTIASCGLGDHLRLPLLAELVTRRIGDASMRRAALRTLMTHDDPRVRAAGLGALASTLEHEPAQLDTVVGTLSAALASRSPVVAGAAADAAAKLYGQALLRPSLARLDRAIVTRAASETDVELASSLYGLAGQALLEGGAEACRRGLGAHPVRARAARECLRAYGEPVPAGDVAAAEPPPGDPALVIGRKVTWTLETSRGPIVIELRPDVAPWATTSIVLLTRRGFYDGKELHRVVANFVAQGGDPTESGWGGPGYTLPAEPASRIARWGFARPHNTPEGVGAGFMAGGVGLADAGPDSAGSQWFVMHAKAPHLDGRYTWVGSIVSGHKSADALLIGDRVERATISIE
jgi:cyclophilin family peptidyl-prolyl cis-trans isomerase/HEAT repeat protein